MSRSILTPTRGPHPFPTAPSVVAEALAYFRRPRMPAPNVDVALFPDCNSPAVTFADTDALAKHLHRKRGRLGIELHDGDTVQVQDDGSPLPVVSLYLHDDASGRVGFLGHAWLRHGGRQQLERALKAQRRVRMPRHAVLG